MSSEPIRDPAKDHLLTPQNAVLIIIDYQPTQVNSIKSMDHQATGAVDINGVRVNTRDGAAIKDIETLRMTAIEDSELILVDVV